MVEFDGPWKIALGQFFEPFMRLCFPAQHAAIDWSGGVELLEQELQQLAADTRSGQRAVDKLVRVRLLDGAYECVLVHVEIQSQRQPEFAERVYEYYYRLVDKLRQPVVSLAVLGDSSPNWRPDRFSRETLGCRLEFSFPLVKLLDFSGRIEALHESRNPFAILILAHLAALQTAKDTDARFDRKLSVARLLFQHGFAADHVRQLFRVIDGMLDLPPPQAVQFWEKLKEFEMSKPYITTTEQMLLERGLERGLLSGRVQTLQQVLGEPISTKEDLAALSDEELAELAKQLSDRLAKK